MSKKPNKSDSTDTRPAAAKKSLTMPNIDAATLTDGAKKTGRYLWGGLVVLATFGGVLGLFQFVKGVNVVQSAEISVSANSQQQLLQMVQDGKLSVADAKDLARALAGDALSLRLDASGNSLEGSPLSPSQITKLATSDNPDKRRALVLMTDRETYSDGLDILEAAAKTSDDWDLLGQYSSSTDPERALRAARKAITLDPDNLFAMSLLSLMQLEVGDFSDAERTAQTYLTLSREENDEVLALTTLMRIYARAANKTQTTKTFMHLKEKLDNWDIPNVPTGFTEDDLDQSPHWAAMHGNHVVAWQYLTDEDGEQALKYLNKAIGHMDKLILALPENYKLLRRKANLLGTRVNIEGRLLKDEEAEIKTSKAIYALRRKIFEMGAPFSGIKLVEGYSSLVSSLLKEDDIDGARDAQEKQMNLINRIRRKDKESIKVWGQWMTAKWGQAQLEKEQGNTDKALSISNEMLAEIGDFLRAKPADNERGGLYLSALSITEQYANEINGKTALSEYLEKAIAIFAELEADVGNDIEFAKSKISFTNWAGSTALRRKQIDEAKTYYLASLDISLAARKTWPNDKDIKMLTATTYTFLGYLKDEGLAAYNAEAVKIFEPFAKKGELDTRYQQYYSMALGRDE